MYLTLTCVEFAVIVGAIKRVRRFKATELPAQRRIQAMLLGKFCDSDMSINDNSVSFF